MATDTSYPRQGVNPFTIPGDHWGTSAPVYSTPSSPTTTTPAPQVPIATPPLPAAGAPLDPAQLAAVLYDKAIPLGYSTRAQWGGRIIEGPVFNTVGTERVVSFIAGYYIPVNFWDATRAVTELYFRGQLAWRSSGALLTGLNVGVPTAGGAQTVRFATGTLAQTPDAWSVARFGAQAVAYVPLVTATFENIRTAQFGNIVPFTSVTVEDTAVGFPGDLAPWADAVEALARHDGRGPEEFETVDVAGGINALILGSEIDFTAFLGGMRKHKPQWNVRTADKLYLVDKGSFSLDLTLDQARLVSHRAQPIVVHTSDAFDKPREKVCHYLDVDRDYEPSNVRVAEDIDPVVATDALQSDSYDIPVASSADVVMAETAFAYYTEEVARTKSEFSGTAHYLALEPGDCYKWTSAAGRQYFHRVNEIVRRADFTVDVKGEGFLTCAIESGHNWNRLDVGGSVVLTNGSLTAESAAANSGVRWATGYTEGKRYWECRYDRFDYFNAVGVATASADLINVIGNFGIQAALLYGTGNAAANGVALGSILGLRHEGDVIGTALNIDDGLIFFRVAPSGNWNGNAGADPTTGAFGIDISALSGALFPVFAATLPNNRVTANAGDTAFSGTIPSGYLALSEA
jgi:hypothetical protein